MSVRTPFLTKPVVKGAIAFVEPAIRALMEQCHGEHQNVLHINVQTPNDLEVDHQIGDLASGEWKYPYDDIAIKKTEMAIRSGSESFEVRFEPWLLQSDDTPYVGSAYYKGIAVGVSGMDEDTDELVAHLILRSIIRASRREYQEGKSNVGNFME